jgi:hypothetical protein
MIEERKKERRKEGKTESGSDIFKPVRKLMHWICHLRTLVIDFET